MAYDAAAHNNDLTPFLEGREFEDIHAEYNREGYVIFESVLSDDELQGLKDGLAPHLGADVKGRNDFEGFRSNRVYALLGKSPVFAELATHPLALAFAEAELGRECLLSACLAINLQPGETAQPWHYDDSHYRIKRPRESLGVSAFWNLSETTETNGATEIIPRSHLWGMEEPDGATNADVFNQGRDIGEMKADPRSAKSAHPDAIKATMPAGSLMIAKGTLWHRGGANNSDEERLIITPQYCPGWTRGLENMSLAVPPEKAAKLSPRAQELIGYSIHPPFMGYVDGMHPRRVLA